MELTPYVEMLREELSTATQATDGELREAVERALRQLDPTARLVFMNLLADSDAEITRLLQECGVDATVQAVLKGRDPSHQVHVDFANFAEPFDTTPRQDDTTDTTGEEEPDAGETVRITLRLPAKVKAKADVMAEDAGMSLNSWIVDAVREANRGLSADIREFQQVMSTLQNTWGRDKAGKAGKAGWQAPMPPMPPRRGKSVDGWM